MKSQLIGKDPDAGKDSGQEEKGATEDEIDSMDMSLSKLQEQWTGRPEVLQSMGLQRVGQLSD